MDVTVPSAPGEPGEPGQSGGPASDPRLWAQTRALLDRRDRPKWASLSWVTLRPLVSAVNDRVAAFAPRLVDELRGAWSAEPQHADDGAVVDPGTWTADVDGVTYRRVVHRPDDSAFVVLGDTGEQDASQYVLVPALRAAAAGRGLPDGERPGFVVICSDVVYPSGDEQDYVHALYLPYGPRPDAPRPDVPPDGVQASPADDPLATLDVLALPGNHDWYDGLTGFSSQFCGARPLPAAAYGWSEGIGVREAAARLVWRRPARVRPARLWRPLPGAPGETLRREERPAPLAELRRWRVPSGGPWRPLQPGSYYAVDTRDLLVVCIDTGIADHGEPRLDAEQSAWLVEISRHPKPKLLLTGNPLLVNAVWKRCTLDTSLVPAGPGRPAPAEVRDLVHDPAHGYVAVIGGDVHNFQHYEVPLAGGRTMTHVVSGGGGAYLSATHPVLVAAERRRARRAQGRVPYAGEGDPGPLPVADRGLYPGEEESLQRFGRLLLVRTWRFLRIVVAVLVGVVGAAVVAAAAAPAGPARPPGPVPGPVLAGGAAVLGALVLLRVFLPSSATGRAVYRAAFLAGSVLAGAVLVLATWWLDPAWVVRDVAGWAGLTAAGSLLAWFTRRSSWWREPRDAGERPPPWVLPVAAAVWLLLAGAAVVAAAYVVLGTLVVLATVAVWGWRWGRRGRLPGRLQWKSVAAVAAYVAEGAVALAVVGQVVVDDRTAWNPVGVVVGVVLAPVWALAGLTAVVGVLRVVLPVVRGPAWRAAYGTVGRPAQWVLGVMLAAGPVVALVAVARAGSAPSGGSGSHSDPGTPGPLGAGLAALTAVTVAVLAVLIVDAVRRSAPRWGYKVVNLGVLGISVVLHVVVFRGTWVPRATVTVLVVAAFAVLTVVLVNLTFLGTYALLLDREAQHADLPGFRPFGDADARQVLLWRKRGEAFKPADTTVVRRAQIVFPSTDQPQGPVQRKVSEFFDSDSPPFAKHFLLLRTDGTRLTITVQPVDGVRDLEPWARIELPLRPAVQPPDGVPGTPVGVV